MKFGKNDDVNYVKPVETITASESSTSTPTTTSPPTTTTTSSPTTTTTQLSIPTNNIISPRKTSDEMTYVLGSAATLGFLFAKYVW